MTDYKTRRDEAAFDLTTYCQCPGPTCSGCEQMSMKLFTKGADWATAHWLGQVRRLVTALEVYAMTNETFPEYGDVAREALAKWAELTKQNETKE